MHSALVSISGTKDEMFVHIQLMHSFIKKVFGIEHIRFYNYKGEIKLQEAKHPLVHQIAQLINSKLKDELKDADTTSLKAV